MSTSKPVRKAAFLVGIALAVLFTAISLASAQTTVGTITGHVVQADRTVCAYDSPFLSGLAYRFVELVDASGNSLTVPPQRLSDTGLYSLALAPGAAGLRATCDGTVVNHTLTPAELSSGTADLILLNSSPVVTSFTATFHGGRAERVPPGSTVDVSAQATDANGDALEYRFAAAEGTLQTDITDPQRATWTLPSGPGLHFIYLLVFDFRGGYVERQLTLSTDSPPVWLPYIARSGASSAPPVVPPAPAGSAPSDHTPAVSHFLTFYARDDVSALDTEQGACEYYRNIGVVPVTSDCTQLASHPEQNPFPYQSFAQWKQYWFRPGGSEASALYANLADLNLQRDMHTVVRPASGRAGNDVASYVCNYPNPDADVSLANARLKRNLVACVAFEYSVTSDPRSGAPWNSGKPFTKFITFSPDGNLLLSVNLDGRGEKFMPGACSACHAIGQYHSYAGGDPSFLNARFLPYDLDNYRFSTLAPYRRQDQEAGLYALNQAVLSTDPYTATRNLINGWYARSNTFDGRYVPAGWAGNEALYNAVVKPNCRMCHAPVGDSSLDFDSYAHFNLWSDSIARDVCGFRPSLSSLATYAYSMPNAKQTFDRFWNSVKNAPPAVNEVDVLQAWLRGALNPAVTCQLPSWVP